MLRGHSGGGVGWGGGWGLHKGGCLLASIGLHFRKVEADTLVQTVGLMGGGTTLYWVAIVVPGGDICRANCWHVWQCHLQLLRG